MHNFPNTILITGASSGLGRALSIGFARPGSILSLCARHEGRLNEVAKLCRDRGAIVETARIDVMEKEKIAAWIIERDTAHPLDLVIANAGISNAGATLPLEVNQRIFDVNFQGVINTIHPIIPRMQSRRQGQVAIMSSLAGFRGMPRAPAYSASKAAVRVYGDALGGLLIEDNVVVSVICPGFVRTPLTDVNPFPMPFLMDADKAAQIMIKKLIKKKPLIAYPTRMHFVVWLLMMLPTRLARWITRRL